MQKLRIPALDSGPSGSNRRGISFWPARQPASRPAARQTDRQTDRLRRCSPPSMHYVAAKMRAKCAPTAKKTMSDRRARDCVLPAGGGRAGRSGRWRRSWSFERTVGRWLARRWAWLMQSKKSRRSVQIRGWAFF